MRWDEFQVAVLVDRYEYKVERNYGISAVKFHLIPPFDRLKTSSPKAIFPVCNTFLYM